MRSSWKPSGRSGPTARCTLTLAGARAVTASAGGHGCHRLGGRQPGEVGHRQLLAAGGRVDARRPQPHLGGGGAAGPPGQGGAQALAAHGEGGVDDGEGGRRSPGGGGRRTRATSPESTLGSGQNTRRPTLPARRTSPYQAALTEGTP